MSEWQKGLNEGSDVMCPRLKKKNWNIPHFNGFPLFFVCLPCVYISYIETFHWNILSTEQYFTFKTCTFKALEYLLQHTVKVFVQNTQMYNMKMHIGTFCGVCYITTWAIVTDGLRGITCSAQESDSSHLLGLHSPEILICQNTPNHLSLLCGSLACSTSSKVSFGCYTGSF